MNRNLEMSKAERLLSYSLLSLISAKPIATLPSAGVNTLEEDLYFQSDQEELDESEEPKKAKGYMNEQGVWCWREGCEPSRERRCNIWISACRSINCITLDAPSHNSDC